MRSTVAPKGGGTAYVRWAFTDVIEVEFRGSISAHVVNAAVLSLSERLAEQRATFLLIDGTDIERYDADVRGPGVALLKAARQGGVVAGACVSPNSAVRMMGAAVAFVSSLAFDFVATREDALSAIDRRRLAK